MKNNVYGYVRVSTKDQNEARQVIAMQEFGIDEKHIFLDKQSGKDFNRSQYRKLIRRLKKGDTLVIKSIDRLGRNYDEIIEQWRIITKEKEAAIVVLDIAGIRIFGVQVYGVLTGSMEPTHPTGSLIYVKRTDASDLRVNDVITFSISPNVIATHRIVEIVPDENNPSIVRYRTKGDANKDVDASLVSASNIIGKVMFSIPQLGYIANFIQHPPGIYVAILVCGLTIAFVFYTDSLENKQKDSFRRSTRRGHAPQKRSRSPQSAQQNKYARQSQSSRQGDYSRQSAYPSRNGYRQSEYPQQGAYSHQNDYYRQNEYPQQQGYPRQSGYQQQSGYAQQSGYSRQNEYPHQNGYPRQSGYQQQSGYAQQSGYSRQSAYLQQNGYPSQNGYSQQRTYRQQNEYPQQRAHPQQSDESQKREYSQSRDSRTGRM